MAAGLLGSQVRIPPGTWMFVLCVLHSKDKRHSEDNQDINVVQMKYREQKKKIPLGTCLFLLYGTVKTDKQEKVQTEDRRRNSGIPVGSAGFFFLQKVEIVCEDAYCVLFNRYRLFSSQE